jgi:hypothetical protein
VDRWKKHPRYLGATFPELKMGIAGRELVQFVRDVVETMSIERAHRGRAYKMQ